MNPAVYFTHESFFLKNIGNGNGNLFLENKNRTRTNARASHTKLRTRKCPNFPKLAYAFTKKYHAKWDIIISNNNNIFIVVYN